MFMVAASVVTTILVLNYHHRHADTHEMPEWVFIFDPLVIVIQLSSNIIIPRSMSYFSSGSPGSSECLGPERRSPGRQS